MPKPVLTAASLLRHLTHASLSLFIGATTAHAATQTCTDQIDTLSPVLSNGFAFNASNTRNQASAIRADNVANLALAYTHVAEGSKEKKGAPAEADDEYRAARAEETHQRIVDRPHLHHRRQLRSRLPHETSA